MSRRLANPRMLRAYSPDQPRDERGRFGRGSGSLTPDVFDNIFAPDAGAGGGSGGSTEQSPHAASLTRAARAGDVQQVRDAINRLRSEPKSTVEQVARELGYETKGKTKARLLDLLQQNHEGLAVSKVRVDLINKTNEPPATPRSPGDSSPAIRIKSAEANVEKITALVARAKADLAKHTAALKIAKADLAAAKAEIKAQVTRQAKGQDPAKIAAPVAQLKQLYDTALTDPAIHEKAEALKPTLSKLTIPMLKQIAAQTGVHVTTGKKADLIDRLVRQVTSRRELHDRTKINPDVTPTPNSEGDRTAQAKSIGDSLVQLHERAARPGLASKEIDEAFADPRVNSLTIDQLNEIASRFGDGRHQLPKLRNKQAIISMMRKAVADRQWNAERNAPAAPSPRAKNPSSDIHNALDKSHWDHAGKLKDLYADPAFNRQETEKVKATPVPQGAKELLTQVIDRRQAAQHFKDVPMHKLYADMRQQMPSLTKDQFRATIAALDMFSVKSPYQLRTAGHNPMGWARDGGDSDLIFPFGDVYYYVDRKNP